MSVTQKDKQLIMHPFTAYHAEQVNIHIIKGEKEFLWDENGKAYIDAVGSWWVNLHGHAHPYINQKIRAQLEELEHVMFSGFTHTPAVHLAEKLMGYLQPHYHQLFYSDNGSTAIEVAIKMALQYWRNTGKEKNKIIAFKNAYHGDTFGAMSVSERDVFTQAFHQHLFRVEYIDLPDEDNLDQVMQQVEEIIRHDDTAAFIFEPLVQGAGGMRMYLAEHLQFLVRLCTDYQVLTIADEVMTGFGRTGKMFAIDHLGLKPDFICLSKGLTGGYLPLGVTAFSADIAQAFEHPGADKTFYHGHSFTANPLSCTAALASLEVFEQEKTMEKIRHIHNLHLDFADVLDLEDLAENVRVCGSILAFDLKTGYRDYFYTNPVKEQITRFFLEEGVVMRPLGNVIYMTPPYCISDESLKKVYDTMLKMVKTFT